LLSADAGDTTNTASDLLNVGETFIKIDRSSQTIDFHVAARRSSIRKSIFGLGCSRDALRKSTDAALMKASRVGGRRDEPGEDFFSPTLRMSTSFGWVTRVVLSLFIGAQPNRTAITVIGGSLVVSRTRISLAQKCKQLRTRTIKMFLHRRKSARSSRRNAKAYRGREAQTKTKAFRAPIRSCPTHSAKTVYSFITNYLMTENYSSEASVNGKLISRFNFFFLICRNRNRK
jgi:hypothetical protein